MTEHSMNICIDPPPMSMPSENTDAREAIQNSTSGTAFEPILRLITRRTSYRPPSRNPSITDAATCAS